MYKTFCLVWTMLSNKREVLPNNSNLPERKNLLWCSSVVKVSKMSESFLHENCIFQNKYLQYHSLPQYLVINIGNYRVKQDTESLITSSIRLIPLIQSSAENGIPLYRLTVVTFLLYWTECTRSFKNTYVIIIWTNILFNLVLS